MTESLFGAVPKTVTRNPSFRIVCAVFSTRESQTTPFATNMATEIRERATYLRSNSTKGAWKTTESVPGLLSMFIVGSVTNKAPSI